MKSIILMILMGTAAVLSQDIHSIQGFKYLGCSKVDISCFSEPVALPGNRITPEACETACNGFQFAALLNEACRCGNDPKSIQPADAKLCDHCCLNDPKVGECGNSCPPEHPNIANVYQKAAALKQYAPISVEVSAVVSSETPCPTVVTTQAPSHYSSIGSAVSPKQDLPCPPTTSLGSTVSPYLTPEGDAPEPQMYATSTIQPASQSSSCSTSSTSSSVCKTTTEQEITPVYQTTLSPVTSKAYGTPPVPSQVPGSDSHAHFIPSFSAIGGLALIAAMII